MAGLSIRQLQECDWELFRQLRLEALTNHPRFFSPSLNEFELNERDWRVRLANPKMAIFGVFDGGSIVGMTGVRENPDDASQAHFIISYLKAEYRGKGHTRLLYETRFMWAHAQKRFTSAMITHRDLNLGPAVHPLARVEDGVVIENSIIGPCAVIESGSIVRGSVLWPGSRIGAGSTLDTCIVCSGEPVTGCHRDADL